MAVTTRQSNLFAAEDWKKIYTTFRSADFQSYDFETLRKSMVDYIRTYYPEDFNDYIESSEFIALLDLMAFMGQSLAFRTDLNARENFMETAERRDSVYRLASLLGYSPNRNQAAEGLLKVMSITTSEAITDSSGRNLSNQVITWDDPTNLDWFEQFSAIINAALQPNQKLGKPASSLVIGNLKHDLYQMRLRSGLVPVFPFSTTVNGTGYPFEIYDANLASGVGITESAPEPSDKLGFVYRNDGRGNGSVNTGFFMAFKQGTLTNLDFTLGETLANRLVGLNINNINNSDVWLFETNDAGAYTTQWTNVDNLRNSNVIYNNVAAASRKIYTVNSRANDQVDLVFGDGIFSAIPTGTFRAVVRVSNGLTYSITPQEMRSIPITIAYISRSGKIESLTLRLSLQYTVSNATARESLTDIKAKAPQFNYTQDRMVNGEDYNTLPFTKFTDIAKIKSVNRTSSGLSRYLDITDPTSKYSSTNYFGDDGYLYKSSVTNLTTFTWTTISDIQRFIRGTLASIIKSKETKHLYYGNYAPKPLALLNSVWVRGTAETDASTGYFAVPATQNSITTYTPAPVGVTVSNNRKYIKPGCLIKFTAPSGKYFDIDGTLKLGTPSTSGQSTVKWATVISVIDDGINGGKGLLTNGTGPVVLNINLPTDAIANEVYPTLSSGLTTTVEQQILTQIQNNSDFGLRYDVDTSEWKVVTATNLSTNLNSNISTANSGDTSNTNIDNSWIIAMINNGNIYTVHSRGLDYYFGSRLGTRFYIDQNLRIFDSRTGSVVKDNVKILASNTQPDSTSNLGSDYVWEIYAPVTYSDGYKDDTFVKVTFADGNDDGVPDDPSLFDSIVNETVNPLNKTVWFKKYMDFDNLERYAWLDPATVNTNYANYEQITLNLNNSPIGTVFFATDTSEFYVSMLVESVRTAVLSMDYTVYAGRSYINFQYKHNAPSDRRIDPTPINLIDMYVLTTAYDSAYRRWLNDTTGTLVEPVAPSVVDLSLSYGALNNYKSVSDTVVFNPAKFRPLFGNKAEDQLQATFKIIKSSNSKISNNELRSSVITKINEYFALDNWDFGDTFYYSELAAYIHQGLAPDIASAVIVPKYSDQIFGSLFQITSQANEIFISAATVDNIEIIDSITSSRLRSSETGVVFTGTVSTSGGNA
mgnify:CR=1 FL=1